MDKLECYRQIIREVLTPLAQIRFSSPGIVNEAVFDTEHDHYLIITTGWEGKDNRIYFNLVHVDIINGKVWIQRDGTEDGIGYALEAAGIPIPPDKRLDLSYLIRQSLLLPKKWGPLNGLPRNPEPFLRLLDTTTLVTDYEDVGALTVDRISDITTPVTLKARPITQRTPIKSVRTVGWATSAGRSNVCNAL